MFCILYNLALMFYLTMWITIGILMYKDVKKRYENTEFWGKFAFGPGIVMFFFLLFIIFIDSPSGYYRHYGPAYIFIQFGTFFLVALFAPPIIWLLYRPELSERPALEKKIFSLEKKNIYDANSCEFCGKLIPDHKETCNRCESYRDSERDSRCPSCNNYINRKWKVCTFCGEVLKK